MTKKELKQLVEECIRETTNGVDIDKWKARFTELFNDYAPWYTILHGREFSDESSKHNRLMSMFRIIVGNIGNSEAKKFVDDVIEKRANDPKYKEYPQTSKLLRSYKEHWFKLADDFVEQKKQ